MKHVWSLLLLLFLCFPSLAQPPEIAWSVNVGVVMESVRPIEREGVICAGSGQLVRLDDDGNILWTHDLALSRSLDMEVCMDGGFIIGGSAMGGDNAGRIIKTDRFGEEEWRYDYDGLWGEWFYEVTQNANGSITALVNGENSAQYVFRPDGTLITSYSTNNHYIKSYQNCNIVFNYYRNDYYGVYYDDIWKTSFYGNSWTHSFSFSNDSRCYSAIQTSNYHIILAVRYDSEQQLVVFNPWGQVLREHPITDFPGTIFWMHETADHKLVLAGSRSYPTPATMYMMKIDQNYEVEWSTNHVFQAGTTIVADFCATSDGGYVFTNGTSILKYSPELTVNISPETNVVPSSGGTIVYDVTLNSRLNDEETLDLWLRVYGQHRRAHVSHLGEMTIEPGTVETYTDSVLIPASLLDGEYFCRFHAGSFEPKIVMGSNRFAFTKGGSGVASDDQLEVKVDLPRVMSVESYPNPFNAMTTVLVDLARQTDLRAEVVNVMGQRVAVLAAGRFEAGEYRFEFDGTGLSSGIYLVNVQAGRERIQQKVMLLR